MRTKVPFFLLSGLAVLLGACNGTSTKSEQELSVYTAMAVPAARQSNQEFPFIAQPYRTSELSFRVGGPIDRFTVYAGNEYKQGSIIAEIDPRDFHLRKQRAEAVYRQSKTEFERIEALYHKENISASTYEKAKADCISAKAAFETTVNELADTRLTAPFTGYVGEVYIEKFQDVKPTQPVLSLIDIHQLKIEIYVTQDIAYAAQSLDSLQIRFDAIAGKTYQAHIVEVSKGTTRNNLSYLLTAMLPNGDGELLAGMSGKAMLDLPLTKSAAEVCIPQAALCHRPSVGDYVWVLNPSTSQVERRNVTVEKLLPNGQAQLAGEVGSPQTDEGRTPNGGTDSPQNGRTIGLHSGETVVTSSLRFLSDGMKVVTPSKTKQP